MIPNVRMTQESRESIDFGQIKDIPCGGNGTRHSDHKEHEICPENGGKAAEHGEKHGDDPGNQDGNNRIAAEKHSKNFDDCQNDRCHNERVTNQTDVKRSERTEKHGGLTAVPHFVKFDVRH